VHACDVSVRNVEMRWKVEVTGHVRGASTVRLLCGKARRMQSHTVLRTTSDPAGSNLGRRAR